MANASIKRIAAQNEKAIRNLRIAMALCTILSVSFRTLFRRHPFPSKFAIFIYVLSFVASIFLYSFLVRAGTPRRDASGMLISSGDDLNQGGLIEWSWDIIYITWACQIGSSILGDWFWWFYLIIPLYATYKLWTIVVSPLLGGILQRGITGNEDMEKPVGIKQEKLSKKQRKGDVHANRSTTKK